MLRVPGRERAKDLLHRFLYEAFERDVMIHRMRKAYEHIIFLQRYWKISYKLQRE